MDLQVLRIMHQLERDMDMVLVLLLLLLLELESRIATKTLERRRLKYSNRSVLKVVGQHHLCEAANSQMIWNGED